MRAVVIEMLRVRKRRLGAALVSATLLLSAAPGGAQPDRPGGDSDAGTVSRSYVVTLQPGHDPGREAPGLARAHNGRVRHVYEHALDGFSFEGSEQSAAALARNPKVRTVVADRRVTTAAQTLPTGIERISGPLSGTVAGNGVGRVDVDVAILDTGIDVDHPDLDVVGGRNCSTGSTYDDGNGHGTHVAGTVGARDDDTGVVGVAPGVRLWAVRVLDDSGSGSWSSVICGIDYVTANRDLVEVANMSLSGSGSAGSCTDGGLREAICRSVAAGVTYVVAAGNKARNAADYVPAAYPEVITVSALADFDGLPDGLGRSTCRTDVDDTLADFSNYGAAVDLIAPGVCIRSTYRGGGYATSSGTSMASPHVAGAAALYRSDHPGASPASVKSALQAAGNLRWNDSDDRDGTKETLLDVDDLGGKTILDDTTPVNAPPVAAFTSSCADLACTFTDASTDTDGTISARQWSFGDGATSAATNPQHTYATGGTYTVTLTATDDGGASDTASTTVTVAAPTLPPPPTPAPEGITLEASGYKVKGLQKAELRWSGATTAVDIYRNGSAVRRATADDGVEVDDIDGRGNGSYDYRVCEAGTAICSSVANVRFG